MKAVIETCYLDGVGIRAAGAAMVDAGVDFVVTSTGMGPEGATEKGVALLRGSLPPTVQVKAAGGILSLADAESMLRAGAARLGSNVAAQILDEAAATSRRGAIGHDAWPMAGATAARREPRRPRRRRRG